MAADQFTTDILRTFLLAASRNEDRGDKETETIGGCWTQCERAERMAARVDVPASQRASRSESDLTTLARERTSSKSALRKGDWRDGDGGECGSQPEGTGTPLTTN